MGAWTEREMSNMVHLTLLPDKGYNVTSHPIPPLPGIFPA